MTDAVGNGRQSGLAPFSAPGGTDWMSIRRDPVTGTDPPTPAWSWVRHTREAAPTRSSPRSVTVT